jgi:hypothetical protein
MAQFTVLRSLDTQPLGLITVGATIDADPEIAARYVEAGYLEPVTPPPAAAKRTGKGE